MCIEAMYLQWSPSSPACQKSLMAPAGEIDLKWRQYQLKGRHNIHIVCKGKHSSANQEAAWLCHFSQELQVRSGQWALTAAYQKLPPPSSQSSTHSNTQRPHKDTSQTTTSPGTGTCSKRQFDQCSTRASSSRRWSPAARQYQQ